MFGIQILFFSDSHTVLPPTAPMYWESYDANKPGILQRLEKLKKENSHGKVVTLKILTKKEN